jgi:hypothetical protein
MEADWIAKRATLRWLLHTHPEWTQKDYAAFLHCSVAWVKKWKKRLNEAAPDDLAVLHARSRAAGTSILLQAQGRDDFHAETAFDAVVAFLRGSGLPRLFTFDRDPRWVGSQSGRDFPSALRRFLLCLGVEPNVCPPHQPQKQADVERYHRSYKYEWRLLHRPGTLQEAGEVTRAYQDHYNWQRPHQGRSCRHALRILTCPTCQPCRPRSSPTTGSISCMGEPLCVMWGPMAVSRWMSCLTRWGCNTQARPSRGWSTRRGAVLRSGKAEACSSGCLSKACKALPCR